MKINLKNKLIPNFVLLLFIFFAITISYSFQVAALEIANFDQPTGVNCLGGSQDVWVKNDAEIDLRYVYKNSEPENVKDEEGFSVELEYDVTGKNKEAGFWSSLRNKNLGIYKELTFWIKGAKGGEKALVAIKDDAWFEHKLKIENYLPEGITTSWQKVEVPLSNFTDIYDWTNLNNFSVSFVSSYGPPYKGKIYIDDFRLEGRRPAPAEPVRKAYDSPASDKLTDEQLLSIVQEAAFGFFWNEANPENGLIKDTSKAFFKDDFPVASMASVGFGLTALCVAENHGWITYKQAYNRILNTLKYLKNDAQNIHGFYYHMVDMKDGTRWGKTEISSIDTALLLAGIVFAGEYFKDTEIEKLADEIYERVDWPWMLNGGKTLSHGFRPESGFIPYRWSNYNEAMILYILAIGSPTHPVAPDTWRAWSRSPLVNYKNYQFIGAPALFTHQYSQIWVDFKGKRDNFKNYFENSIHASLANRQWCIDNSETSATYSAKSWGLTACDGPDGYKAYGAPYGTNDGTVAPTAAIGSIVFTPNYSMDVIKNLYNNYKDRVWGKYGFVDSYNWQRDWVSDKYIGIDQGPIVLMIENYRTGLIWKYFMQNECIKKASNLCGFKSITSLETEQLKK